jgi:ribosomal protein S18 acetylase RimI-like enzyme
MKCVPDERVFLCPVSSEDEVFLRELYASTRVDEFAVLNWHAEQKLALLEMQFEAQRRSYQNQFPTAGHQIIFLNGIRVGRLVVDRSGEPILLIDIALLPEHRRSGIGTSLIRDLQAEAKGANRIVQLHVEASNQALRLYERLGFERTLQRGLYWEMEWRSSNCGRRISA